MEGDLKKLKHAVDGTRWLISVAGVVMIGGFAVLGFQINRLDGRLERVETAIVGIPARLSDEFRAMRAEMAAQTSAIANPITAIRQAQPPPQIIVIPAPQPGGKSSQP